MGAIFIRVPAHLEQLVNDLEEEAELRAVEQDAVERAAAEEADRQAQHAAAEHQRLRRQREPENEARDVAEELPDSSVMHESEIRVPKAERKVDGGSTKKRRTVSLSAENEEAEDDARRHAIAAVDRMIDANSHCSYSSTARSSNSAS